MSKKVRFKIREYHHKICLKIDEILSKYLYRSFWLLAGLAGIFLFGKPFLYDEIRKNDWENTPAVITENWIQERAGSKRNKIDQYLILVWKYKIGENEYSGKKETRLHDNNRWLRTTLVKNKKINILVNPDYPSESALFNWNSLTAAAQIMRSVIWAASLASTLFGVYLLRKPAKKPQFTVYYFDTTFSFRRYLLLTIFCIGFFIIVALLTRFGHKAFFILGLGSFFILPLCVARLFRFKNLKPEFFVSCSNPRCFSSKISPRNHASIIVKDNCPSCNAPLNIERVVPEHQIEFPTLPDPKKLPVDDYVPILFILGWILLLLPLLLYLQPPNTAVSDNVRYSNILLCFGWVLAGIFSIPLFSFASRKMKKSNPITCSVCGNRFSYRKTMTLLRNTGNCTNCGAKIIKMEGNDE
ncbi:MAG: DUF3592 domain-containing protein [Victivallaceae bacterium]|nr:DUF3592 domain-containing protein [Victivallaceae bacterium]